jgi:hypothetical protein
MLSQEQNSIGKKRTFKVGEPTREDSCNLQLVLNSRNDRHLMF